MIKLIDELYQNEDISDNDLKTLIEREECGSDLFRKADSVRQEQYGKDVYIRGLIEFTSHCKNNCYYCGIRQDNNKLVRYRLRPEEILDCCNMGYRLGLRTFVLQGGEDSVL